MTDMQPNDLCRFIPFKKCPACGYIWRNCADLLSDPCVKLAGYQTNFLDPGRGFFLFKHEQAGCRTTFAVAAEMFADLYGQPTMDTSEPGRCPPTCLYRSRLLPCPSRSECDYVSSIVDIINNWRKT